MTAIDQHRSYGFRFLLVCSLLSLSTGSLVVHTSPTPQHCTAGSAIALSCTFPVPFGTPLHGIALKWTVSTVDNDHRTLYTFDGTSEWQFYNHSTVDRLRLIQGDATLHLKNVTLSDAGHYTCTVFIPPEMGASTFRLAVSVLPSVTLSPEFPFVTIGEEKMLVCDIQNFYPMQIDIAWFIRKGALPESLPVSQGVCTGIPVAYGNQTLSVQSQILIRATAEANGAIYTCQIKHQSYSSPFRINTTLTVVEATSASHGVGMIAGTAVTSMFLTLAVLGAVFIHVHYIRKVPPKVSEIIVPEMIYASEAVTLICNITSVQLKQVKVQWLRCHGHKHVSTSAKVESTLLQEHFEDLSSSTENKPFKNSLMSCLSIVPSIEDDDREYQCKVCCLNIHPIIKKTCLKILVRPSHFQIESVPRIPMPEQNLVLSCRAERFYPKVISLKWFKDELPVKGVTQFGPFLDGGKLYSVWSQTEFLVSSNDQGAIYTCRVHHGSLTGFREITYKINLQGAAPEVSWITSDPSPPKLGQECTLNCRVTDFLPETITVTWFKNGQPALSGVYSSLPVLNIDGRYSLWTFYKFTPTVKDSGSIFKCVVEHCALKGVEERSFKLEMNDTV
ncbi:uncharacterized protein LOC120515071 [Polypterus senegalus]|uniref:uncharacterized protein LOC120515071 n=1 Tax=Polypterus senegalus TaxID=55291 RepID=UPI0019656BD5|nr:uncharacterized protein LOC120515071 [Polypterus senegalus]